MNYEFTSNDKECFSLHDCRADGAELTGDQLILYFTKGIFYNEYGDYWPNTGRAAVEFVIEHVDEITFYLFKEKGKRKLFRNILPGSWLIKSAVRSGSWSFCIAMTAMSRRCIV